MDLYTIALIAIITAFLTIIIYFIITGMAIQKRLKEKKAIKTELREWLTTIKKQRTNLASTLERLVKVGDKIQKMRILTVSELSLTPPEKDDKYNKTNR